MPNLTEIFDTTTDSFVNPVSLACEEMSGPFVAHAHAIHACDEAACMVRSAYEAFNSCQDSARQFSERMFDALAVALLDASA